MPRQRVDRTQRRHVRRTLMLALTVLVAISVTPISASAATGPVRVTSTSLGQVLSTPQGRTLYVLTADAKGKSTCTGSCAASWPPVIVKERAPAAGQGVTARLGTITRADGKFQLTVNGWPVYTFKGDSAKGQVNGQGIGSFGGKWWVVGPNGKRITTRAALPSSPSAEPSATLDPGDFY